MPPGFEHACAACGAHHASTRRRSPAIGRPWTSCGRCGGFVARPPFEEWRAMAPADRLRLVVGELAIAVCAGLLPAAGLALWGLAVGPRPGRATMLVAAAAGVVVATALWLSHLGRRVGASRRRMADPMYTAKLVEFELAVAEDDAPPRADERGEERAPLGARS